MELTLEKATETMACHHGNLDLRGTNVTGLPEGLKVGGNLDLYGTRVTSLPEGLKVGGWLNLKGTGVTCLPEGLTVGGSLFLSGTRITALPEGLTVGHDLFLRGTRITALPEGLTAGGSLDLTFSCITFLPEGLTVGGRLDLDRTGITSLPEGLTVGGSLDLRYTNITSLPERLTVCGWLALDGTIATRLPEDLALGGELYLNNTRVVGHKANKPRDGDYAEGRYLYADGILTHVKKKKSLKGYTFFVGRIPGKHVVSDGKRYAHCRTLREGIADLAFKAAKDRGADQYRGIGLDEERPVEELVAMYRVITGACRQGTRAFVDGFGDGLKERYTVREAIGLTKGQYGADKFAEFFGAA